MAFSLAPVLFFSFSSLCVITGRPREGTQLLKQSAVQLQRDIPRLMDDVSFVAGQRTRPTLCKREAYFVNVSKHGYSVVPGAKDTIDIGECRGACPYSNCRTGGDCRIELYGKAYEYHRLYMASKGKRRVKRCCVPIEFNLMQLIVLRDGESQRMDYPFRVAECGCRPIPRKPYDVEPK
eukprot:m.18866 g.18866  ORF g.18866 m.18866 type:complete len:179 (+) comp27745_c0_seq1:120-656(+)